jgi:hypothetical protein
MNLYLDAKLVLDNKPRETISNSARNYKNAKMGGLKLDKLEMKEAVSEILSNQ